MADIFLSYARADGSGCADFVQRVLEEEGWSVFRDRDRILGGQPFPERIRAELEDARCVLTLWSEAALGSDWVRREAHLARGQQKLIPVSIDGVEPPGKYSRLHYISMVGWEEIQDIVVEEEYDEDLDRLASAIIAMLSEQGLYDQLYAYMVHVCSDRIRWCVPSRIREDAALYLRFPAIAEARLDQIREALDQLSDEGWILKNSGKYAFA